MRAPHALRGLFSLAACAALLSAPRAASAEPPRDLRYETAIDLPLTIAGAVAWVGSEALKGDLAPASCRWCDPPGIDSSVRDALRWSNPGTADTISNVLGFGLIPAMAFGGEALVAAHDDALDRWPVDAMIVAESTVAASVLNQGLKFLVGRERPFVHALPADQKGSTPQPSDNNLSFFSGHTSITMALAVSTGTVASMRRYSWAPAAWAVLPAMSIFTGYLRIGADKHYFTDVTTGALIGAAMGFVIPYVFHRPRAEATSATAGALTPSFVAAPGGAQLVGLSGVF